MTKKQAQTIPVGMRVAFYDRLNRDACRKAPLGTVTEKLTGGLYIKWDDGQQGWIDYRDAGDIFVPGLPRTRT